MDKPLSKSRINELLDYATNYRANDEHTPGLSDLERDVIRAYKELLMYKERHEQEDVSGRYDEEGAT